MNNLATKLTNHHQLKFLINTRKLLVKPLGLTAIVQEWTSLQPFWAVQVEYIANDNGNKTYQLTQTTPPPILVPIVRNLPTKYKGTFEEVCEFLVKLTTRFQEENK